MHQIATGYRDRLDRLITIARNRTDFAYFSVERIGTDGSGESGQAQIRRVPDPEADGDTLEGLDVDDVADRLITDKELIVGGTYQVTANFWGGDEGSKIDPFKRQRRRVRLVVAGSEEVALAEANRPGDHRLLDSAAAIMSQVGDRADGVSQQLVDNSWQAMGIIAQMQNQRLADHMNHHADLMDLHRVNQELRDENYRLKNEGIFTQLAKLEPAQQETVINNAMGALGILVQTAQDAYQESKKDKEIARKQAQLALELQRLELDKAKSVAPVVADNADQAVAEEPAPAPA